MSLLLVAVEEAVMKSRKQKRLQKAFSMVETLVAVIVLAVGLLGIAALYVTTLRSGGSAIARTQAVYLASDIADRIRANAKAKGAYAGAGANNDCMTAACSREDMAAFDLDVWQTQITATLPGPASGTVTFVDGTPATYTIEVSWSEKGVNENYVLVAQI
jgi:type IV pilus assembly protein PilV